jgi:hypothetical protein
MNRRNFLKRFIAATTVATLAPVSLVEVPVTETTKFVSFEERVRITLAKYRPIFADSITAKSPYVEFLRSRT